MNELPPLQWVGAMQIDDGSYRSLASADSVEARERILQARIAELEAEVHAHTEAVKVFEAANAELQADAERHRSALDWVAVVNAIAIDAARKA